MCVRIAQAYGGRELLEGRCLRQKPSTPSGQVRTTISFFTVRTPGAAHAVCCA